MDLRNLFVILPLFLLSCNNQRINTEEKEGSVDSTNWLKPTPWIRDIFEDSKGNLWFYGEEWVCRYDGENLKYFSEIDGLSCAGKVHEDQNGLIWIECGTRAFSFDGLVFTPFELLPDTTGNHWDVQPGDLWFQKGMNRFGNTPGPPGIYRNRKGRIAFLPYPLPIQENDNAYYATAGPIYGQDGRIWFGTMEVVIGFKDGEFTLIDRLKMGRENDPRYVGIRGLFSDSKGRLWLADNGAGYFVYEGDSVYNFTERHGLGKDDKEGNTLHRAFAVSEDREGNMWFGTVYSGIWRFDGKEFRNFGKEDGFPAKVVWGIYRTRNGDLLFAADDPGGVFKYNGNRFYRVF